MDVDARIEALEAENDRLRDAITELEEQLGIGLVVPLEWRLTKSESAVAGCLLRREHATKQQLFLACSRDVDTGERDPKIVDVYVCKIRAKLRTFDVPIETIWGVGYRIAAPVRQRVLAELKGETQ